MRAANDDRELRWCDDAPGPAAQRYRAVMAQAGRPLPWTISLAAPEVIEAANGETVTQMAGGVEEMGAGWQGVALAAWIVAAVNTCGGYRAGMAGEVG